MTPVMMRPAKLAQTAVAAFEEAMALQGRPSSLIRFIECFSSSGGGLDLAVL